LDYLRKQKRVIESLDEPPAWKEGRIGELEREMGEYEVLASEGISTRLGRALGYVELVAPEQVYKETGDQDYDPAALEMRARVERAAMDYAIEREREEGCEVDDVSSEDLGYDL